MRLSRAGALRQSTTAGELVKRAQIKTVAVTLVLIAAIFVTDRALPPDVSAAVLYVIPIMLMVTLAGDARTKLRALAVITATCLCVSVIDFLLISSASRRFHLSNEVFSIVAQLTAAALVFMQIRSRERERENRERAEAEHRRLMSIHSIAAATTGTLDLGSVLGSVADSMAALLATEDVLIWLADEEGRELRPAFHKSRSEQSRLITERYPAIELETSQLAIAEAVRRRAVVTIGEGYDTPPESAENLRVIGARMAVLVPLFAHETLVGAMALASSDARRLGQSDEALIETVGKQVAIAIENARLFGRVKDQRERLALVNEIGQVFASTLDLQTIYVAVQNRLSAIIDCDTLLISLYDAQTETIRCTFAYTDGTIFPPEQFEPLKLGVGPQSECIRTARPIIVDNIKKRFMGKFRYVGNSPENPLSVLYVPMIAEDRVVGVIQAQSVREGAYTEEDAPLLSIIANQAATAIPKARLYNEAIEGRREMEHANRIKDEFLAILSHELRTPLTPILGWTRILKDLPPNDLQTRAHALEVIERNANFQTKLVNDLLDMSRIESGKLSLFLQPTDLDAAVEAALDSLRNEAADRGVGVESRLGAGHAMVSADPARLEQIIRNLLTNAIKYTDGGGRVTVTTERAGESVSLTVTDTGVGIARDFLPHIFERFRQADSSTSRRHGGLGLGLSLVKSLVDMHGGEITAHSDGAGRGSSFTVRLRLAPPAAGADGAGEQAPVTAAPPGDLTGGDLTGLRLMVVEDNPDTLEMMRLLCEAAGISVIAAETVEQALALAGAEKPDLIISDISLPVVDGCEFARRIRADATLGNVPLIAITGMASDEDRRRAMDAGFNAYLTKPIEHTSVLNVMRELLAARVVTSD
jgi:signal transduction histidine kinase/CheY-like chemotaxis protein